MLLAVLCIANTGFASDDKRVDRDSRFGVPVGISGDLELELSAELLHQFFWCVKDFGILRPADAVVDVASVVTQNHEDSVRFQRIYGTVHNQGALWCGQMKVKKQGQVVSLPVPRGVIRDGDVAASVVEPVENRSGRAGRDRAGFLDRDGRVVDPGDLPTAGREPQRVTALAARQVQCLAVGRAVAYSTSSSLGGAPQTSSVSSYFLSQAAASIDDDGSATQWLRTPSIGFLRRAARVGIAMETNPRTAVTATMEP